MLCVAPKPDRILKATVSGLAWSLQTTSKGRESFEVCAFNFVSLAGYVENDFQDLSIHRTCRRSSIFCQLTGHPRMCTRQQKSSTYNQRPRRMKRNQWQLRMSTTPVRLHHCSAETRSTLAHCSGKVCLGAGTITAPIRLRGCGVFCGPC